MRITRSRSGTSTVRLELRELGLVGAGILIASVFWLSMFVAAPVMYRTGVLPVDFDKWFDLELKYYSLGNTLEAHRWRFNKGENPFPTDAP